MTSNTPLVLQYRWKIVHVGGEPRLLYYGVRNPPRHRDVLLEISPALASRLSQIENTVPLAPEAESDIDNEIRELNERGVLVAPEARRREKTPLTMQTCTRCVVNDYVVPGLEFDKGGVCALCQCYELPREDRASAFATVSEKELLDASAKNRDSRFDAMVLYTGGKDSSFMLWLLARKLKLRVLAAFWNMPYCSDAAYANIRRAQRLMPEVEFMEWTLPLAKVQEAMRTKWRVHGWPCLCPTVAFPLFYPLAFRLGIPFVFLGIEDVQAAVLDHVVAPTRNPTSPPAPREQTLAFLAMRALPREQKPPLRWPDEMANYHAAVHQAMPELFEDLSGLVQEARANPALQIPLIGRLSTNKEYGTWADAARIIEHEMGWQAPEGQNNLLHTSCSLEPVKDYLQFQRFRDMRTVFMPQSLVELGAAVSFGLTPRQQAIEAVQELGYWRVPPVLERLLDDLDIDAQTVAEAEDELRPGLAQWAGLKD